MTDPFDPAAVRAAYDDVAADYAAHFAAAGLVVDARLVRAAEAGDRTRHAHLLAHRPAA